MDYASGILDEIALEGLDGITIEALWLRLADRSNFIFASHVTDSEETQKYLWTIIKHLRDVEFFVLNEPRKPLILKSCYTIDPELGILTETGQTPEDLYPHKLINDTTARIVGSCSTYDARSNVTAIVRKLNLNDVLDLYRDTLVIVASQEVRKKTLISLSTNPNLEVSPIQFCILERIGRSRHYGEPTQGKLGLSALGEDAKTIFYLRKYLLKHGLITKQIYQNKTAANTSGLLLHLPRFYRLVKPRYITLIEKVLKILADEPNHLIDYDVLREKMQGVLKKLTKVVEFQKYFRSDARIPYRTLYPNAEVKAWKQKSCDKEKKLRVVELRDPNADIRELQKRLLGNCEDEDDEDDKLDGILNEEKRFIDLSLMGQCCILLKERGVDGFSRSEIAREMGFPKVQSRTITKNLVKSGAVGMYMVDEGRQRISKYYLKHCSVINDAHSYLLDDSFTSDGKFTLKHRDSETDVTHTENESESAPGLKYDQCTVSLKKTLETDGDNLEMMTPINGIDSVGSRINFHKTRRSGVKKHTKRKNNNYDSPTSKKKAKLQLEYDEKENVSTEEPDLKSHTDIKRPKQTVADSTEIEMINVDINESIKSTDNEMDVENTCEAVDLVSNRLVTEALDKATMDVLDIKKEVQEPNKTLVSSTERRDLNKANIDVTITDDCSWLLPKTCKNELLKLKSKSLKTFRLLKRSNFIIEAVEKLKVITDLKKLTVMINESEFKEGLACRMDKKSLLRILFKLATDKHIKVYRVTLKHQSKAIHLSFICRKNVKPDDPIIRSVIDFNKLKFHSVSAPKNIVPNMLRMKRMNITFEKRSSFSHYPKFNRMKVMHRFLFFLVYDYVGSETLDQDLAKSKIMKEHQLSNDELNAMPKLYQPKIDEQMFVPPLPKYNEQGMNLGWCLMSDVLVRMPLSVFVRLVQIPYFIPELDDFMNHPVKRYYLVSDLPSRIRNCITATRKYIFTIYEVMMKLVYIGLLQFGAHHNKEKDQIFAFVNRKGCLIDTTFSKPGYNKVSTDIDYPVHNYRFESMETVEEYWHSCWKICMNTRLGGRLHVMGTEVILENIQDKQEMIDAVKAREFMEAAQYDTGDIPGDHLGAAGFDSAMYAHLKRNWCVKNKSSSVSYDNTCNTKALQIRKVQQMVSSSTNKSTVRSAKRKHSESKTSSTVTVKTTTKKDVVSLKEKPVFVVPMNRLSNSRKPRIKVRRINPVKKSLHRKPYYDQVDKEALKRMSKLRVDWSTEEDRVLLICKVASAFICSDTRKQVNANMFLAFREVLHKMIQSSKNKTSRACQRRVAYMLRSQSMSHNINLCIEELRQDEYIMKTYGNTMELIKEEARLKGKRIIELGNIWRDRFKSLVNDLMNHYYKNSFNNFSFSSVFDSKSANTFLLPGSLVEFHERYNLQQIEKKQYRPKDIFKPVNNVNDIYSAVINTTIHSTLSCNSDKTSWSYHLFSIYQQYPERILRNTLNRLRENQMVSFKKSYQVRNKTGNNYYLPLSASPYQLSISYVNLIQTKYQTNLYLDCYETFSELLETCNPEITESASTTSKAFISKGYEVLSRTGGTTAAIIELYSEDAIQFCIEIPNQVIILDPNIKNKDETYSRLVLRYKLFLSNYKKDLTSSVLFQKHNYMSCDVDSKDNFGAENDGIDEADDEINPIEKDQTIDNTRAIQNVAKAASRIALYMMNDNEGSPNGMVPKEMDHVYDFFVVNSCKVFVKVVRSFNAVNMKATSDSSFDNVTSCNVIDESLIKDILQSLRDSAVFYNINPLQYKVSSGIDSHAIMEGDDDDDDEEDSFKIKEYEDTLLEEIINCNFISSDVDLVKSLLAVIKDKREFGLTNIELIKEFGNSLEILYILNKLVEMSFVLKTGVVHIRYIYYSYGRPWLLYSYRNLRCDKDSRVPLHRLKHFQVRERRNSFEEICSDDDIEDVSSNTDIPSSNNTTAELEVSNESNDVNCNPDDVIDDTRWCMEKTNLEKLTKHKMAEPVRVVMRPWIRVDGTLNRRVLDAMLTSVLSHIMLYPGVLLSNIQCRFSPGYQPQQIREICDILLKLNCIISYCVTTKSKPSLFSKPINIFIERSTGLESENDIRYESSNFAIINLGKFLDTRPYTKDFIACLLGR